MTTTATLKVPKAAEPLFREVTTQTDAFCAVHLNAEYAEMARRAAAALGRKRPCPLASGKAQTWACGILYALGQVNFLSDRSHQPSMPMAELCRRFGVGASSGGNKAKEVRDLLGFRMFDPSWTLPSLLAQNPMVWMIRVDGLIVDARHLPIGLQEAAVERGLIPYVCEEGPARMQK